MMRPARWWLVAASLALASGIAARSPARAQTAAPPVPSPFLDSDSWTEAAYRRLDALRLLTASQDVGGAAITRAELGAALAGALERVRVEAPALAVALDAYLRRFCLDYPAACPGRTSEADWRVGGTRLGGGYAEQVGGILAAVGQPPDPNIPPEPSEDVHTGVILGDISAIAPVAAARVVARATSSGLRLVQAYAVVPVGVVRLWAGRRVFRHGYGAETLILSGRVPLDGAGLQTTSFRFPWLFRYLGPVHAELGVFQLHDVAPFPRPWLWTLRGTIMPHPRLVLGAERTGMVAADRSDWGTRLQRVFQIMAGIPGPENYMDNQIAAVDARWRPPVGSLPLSLYIEWGMEDSAGAWFQEPGVLWGAYLGAIPGVPAAAVGIEHVSFPPQCCGNPWWYRHFGFAGGWTDDRVPLGHPLGGQGDEWRAWTDVVVSPAVLGSVHVFRRDRRQENLYAPVREGPSTGAELNARLSASARLDLDLAARYEGGDGWREQSAALTASIRF